MGVNVTKISNGWCWVDGWMGGWMNGWIDGRNNSEYRRKKLKMLSIRVQIQELIKIKIVQHNQKQLFEIY